MRLFGELCLLTAFVGSGFGAFACLVGWLRASRPLTRIGLMAAIASAVAITVTLAVLGLALVTKDFSFKYVTQYSNWLLAWHYSLSALWVGQAGSLLLWAWFLSLIALAYYFSSRGEPSRLRDGALGVLMAYLCFLLAIMVFGADPMEPSVVVPKEGAGLGPLLHHPAMLVHPPIVFLGYAAWTVPFALSVTALLGSARSVPTIVQARPWALFAWMVLGIGILVGAFWAYEELGWGGYWGWDPVENGSLIPWLTGSAFIHALMAWRYCGVLKKTAVSLAIATFGLCNFATFLTRSGVFSSVHAFSQSPIGWMFLILMAALVCGGVTLVVLKRQSLAAEAPVTSSLSREAFVIISSVLLLLLAAVMTTGTLVAPVSKIFFGRQITVGTAFYNNVLVATGLPLLGLMALAPVLRWGHPPSVSQRLLLFLATGLAAVGMATGFVVGLRHPIALVVTGLVTLALSVLVGAVILGGRRCALDDPVLGILKSLRERRREYAGFLIHMGFVCLAIGVTGSSLGTRQIEAILDEGQVIEWAGHTIRYVRLVQQEFPDKLVAAAELEVSPQRAGGSPFTLRPARHLHLLQNEWTTEVAIHSAWAGDFYTILGSGEGEGRITLTLVINPLMRLIWLGGGVMGAGVLVALWPARKRIGLKALFQQRGVHVGRRPRQLVTTE